MLISPDIGPVDEKRARDLVFAALTVGEYFGGNIKEKAELLYKRVEWHKFLCKEKGPFNNNDITLPQKFHDQAINTIAKEKGEQIGTEEN